MNGSLKDTLVNDCLSDALIYQGKSRDNINAQMQKAILQATATSGGAKKPLSLAAESAKIPKSIPLVIVTESLGSKLAFDAIDRLRTNPDTLRAGEVTFDRIVQVFMSANQLPILALADKHLDGTVAAVGDSRAYADDPLAALIKARKLRRAESAEEVIPQIVAFTDPNDLLSYILVPSSNADSYSVIDVVVSNENTFFGFLELPDKAHLGYRTNEVVRRLIACGNPKRATCGNWLQH
jgi:hypothetical protein